LKRKQTIEVLDDIVAAVSGGGSRGPGVL